MPFVVWRSDAKASRPQQGAVRSIDMPSARITCNFPVGARSKPEHRQSQAVSNSVSQTVASEHTKTSIPGLCFSLYSQAFSMRLTSGRAKTTSVIDANIRRADRNPGQLASTYPYDSKQSNSSALRAIRLQQRCNLDPRRDVHTHIFHRICNLARPMETPLCKISF
jgi:hypothetical protein